MLFLAADHRGFTLKEKIKTYLFLKKVVYEDLGAVELKPGDDYPDYARLLAEKVLGYKDNVGIALCGSGAGMNIVLNKFDGIRAGVGENPDMITAQRRDDNINVLVIPTDFVNDTDAYLMVDRFLHETFKSDPKYQRRLNKIKVIEQGN
ncbi:MAG: hypothetical protein UX65_C0006G0004 [Parcubacteria group bacterium GW2011_GWB1_46_8]|nr:MAG: hypothetical protein UX14_C0007G0035 [Parcubacteria group bacterium GW2011_GWF1_45_5]KKU11330.1 MAG: hypothetical protein UX15_C0009G0011 [Parcubacteria group bacterium GW2011_GWA1_45_7]KKU43941.1 MAG: hypothetical protein UX61_C0008G0025 [Parcubacteria group bacterium GW2011_GWA2_46_7]KKU46239.1 MAG: hypothetical protein UX65_C0006G0004 [Parcubacteria group bacterium GW2011_GWB1_46_8]KKU47488.1 MAG: hypothetical protein UX66_C0012G0002 [Parcubacteria group bacterium GW2011_GWF2_46_8]